MNERSLKGHCAHSSKIIPKCRQCPLRVRVEITQNLFF